MMKRTNRRTVSFLNALALFAAACQLPLVGFGQAAATPEVRLWDRFEAALPNEKQYTDPYKNVTLDVTYTTPFGEKVKFWGFYDGGKNWKWRFMPHVPGTWQYEATFSDGTPGASGRFRVVSSDLPGMLRVNRANPLWFSGDIRPVLIRGFHVGDRFFAANWPEEKRGAFLDWAQKQGYNLLSVASHYLNRDTQGRGKGWETPRLWPPDAAEYRRMERTVDDLAKRRIYVYPFAGFFGQQSNYPRDPADQQRYIRYTLARLGPYGNVLLNVAGPEPNKGKTWMPNAEVVRLGRLIGGLDIFGHPLSVHNRTGDDPYRDSDWTTYGTLQGPKTLDRNRLSRGLLESHHPSKPLLAQETLWSGNKFHPRYSDDDLRKNACVINMAAASLVFGDMDGDSSAGFSGTMELADRKQSRHDIIKAVWDFFETVPYYQMKPRQDLVSGGYCLADAGRQYLVYLETGGAVDVAVENGPFLLTWINARNTSDRRAGGTTQDGKGLRAPQDGDDWLLHITHTGRAGSCSGKTSR